MPAPDCSRSGLQGSSRCVPAVPLESPRPSSSLRSPCGSFSFEISVIDLPSREHNATSRPAFHGRPPSSPNCPLPTPPPTTTPLICKTRCRQRPRKDHRPRCLPSQKQEGRWHETARLRHNPRPRFARPMDVIFPSASTRAGPQPPRFDKARDDSSCVDAVSAASAEGKSGAVAGFAG